MPDIVLVAPSDDIARLARQVLQEGGDLNLIEIRTGVLQRGVMEARAAVKRGAGVPSHAFVTKLSRIEIIFS